MDQRVYVAQLNITHFREKLLGALDDAKRQTIVSLLEEEEAKLVALTSHPHDRKTDGS